jgi:hypothetical protein
LLFLAMHPHQLTIRSCNDVSHFHRTLVHITTFAPPSWECSSLMNSIYTDARRKIYSRISFRLVPASLILRKSFSDRMELLHKNTHFRPCLLIATEFSGFSVFYNLWFRMRITVFLYLWQSHANRTQIQYLVRFTSI